jgi:hypothetical protein
VRTALDFAPERLDDQERNFLDNVRQHGWFCTGVREDEEGAGFSYSTGFWLTFGAPEVILFGLQPDTAHAILWDVFRDLKSGRTLAPNCRLDDVFANLPACFVPVGLQHYADHLGWSRWFYRGDEFPCLQLVWPDRAGVFPWGERVDPHFARIQPDLSERGWGHLKV